MRTLSLLASAALTLAFAPAPLPRRADRDPHAADLQRMQGTWQMMRYLIGNRETTVEGCRLLVAGSSATFQKTGRVVCTYQLKPNKGTRPKTMTWQSRSNAAEEIASYVFDGDTLRICWAKEPLADVAPGAGHEFMVLGRVCP